MYQHSTTLFDTSMTRLTYNVNKILANIPKSKLLNIFFDNKNYVAIIVCEYETTEQHSEIQNTIIKIKGY